MSRSPEKTSGDKPAFVIEIELNYNTMNVVPGETVREFKDDEYVGELTVIQILSAEHYAGTTTLKALVYRD